jgi:hypothetical protein
MEISNHILLENHNKIVNEMQKQYNCTLDELQKNKILINNLINKIENQYSIIDDINYCNCIIDNLKLINYKLINEIEKKNIIINEIKKKNIIISQQYDNIIQLKNKNVPMKINTSLYLFCIIVIVISFYLFTL